MGALSGALLTDMVLHGGDLTRATRTFPAAPQPWVDLSTGINPHSYPFNSPPASAFTRLPDHAQMLELLDVAARYYGAPSARNIVAAPGTQILLPHIAALVPEGDAAVLSPTYAEHGRAALLAGHMVHEVNHFSGLTAANYSVVVNPNNPDGRVCTRSELLSLASQMAVRGGMLVVDEAFMDVGPSAQSVVSAASSPSIVVLRSFGKFFGLAGIRLGFAIASEEVISRLTSILGPWAVPGPTIAIALEALRDKKWQQDMRERLQVDAARLDGILSSSGLEIVGGTALFRLVRHPDAAVIHRVLGEHGVLVRRFDHDSQLLRVGLPGINDAYDRLERAIASWRTAPRGA